MVDGICEEFKEEEDEEFFDFENEDETKRQRDEF